MDLPQEFVNRMKQMLGSEYPDFENSYTQPRKRGLRVNTLKILPEQLEKAVPFHLHPVPWIEGAYTYEEEDEKIKEWNFKKQKEDEMFNEISGLVKGMNSDAKNLGMTIDEMRKKTQKMKNQFENVYDNTKKQTERIDKLNKKI